MNGDAHNNEIVPSRVDGLSADEFVVEDIADSEECLSALFDASDVGLGDRHNRDVCAAESGLELDEESEALFRVDAEEVAPTVFGSDDGAPVFSEDRDSSPLWDGGGLELEDGPVSGSTDSEPSALEAAADSFAVELSSMLDDAEDFALDSDVELEVVSSDPGAMSGAPETFLLDDSEGLLGLGDAAELDAGEAAAGGPAAGAAGTYTFDLSSSVSEQGDLPRDGQETSDDAAALREWGEIEASIDQVSEPIAAEVAFDVFADVPSEPTYEQDLGDAVDPASLGPNGAAGASQEGHDIYAEEASSADVTGAAASRRRVVRLGLCAAAAVFVGVGVAVLMWPSLLGQAAAPVAVERVELVRPRVAVAVEEPSAPAALEPPVRDRRPATGGVSNVAAPSPRPDAASVETGRDRLPSEALGDVRAADHGAQSPTTASSDAGAGGEINADRPTVVASDETPFTRVGESLLVGGLDNAGVAGSAALAGMRPGQRAFAQLSNGNYFIGRVKRVSADEVTLRVDTGEVTLLRRDLAQLTRLGSAERHVVEEAAQGSVRLTNDNRLVGGILQRIEDDVIVLEVRQNRVTLPASAVGEIVEGDERGGVRLGTTGAEEQWLRERAERELKSSEGAKRSAAKRPPTVGSERR